MALEYDASFVESEKKSKKRKHDKQDNEHFSDAVNIKKKQKKSEIHQDVGDGGVCKEALDTTLNPVHREDKKNRKLKALEDKSLPSSDHVDVTLEGSDTRDSKILKSTKEKKDDCNIEIEDGKNKTEKMKKDKKKKKDQSKEKDNGGHKGEKEASDQDCDLSKESEKNKRKREKKMMKEDSSATENITEQVEKQSMKKKEVKEVKKKKKRSKKVTFSSKVKVFSIDNDDLPKMKHEKKLIQGKRFTREENEKIKEAVNNYIIEHNLGENGLDMIMHCQKHRNLLENCWKEIGLALPHRPYLSVYTRAHIIFEGGSTNKWSKEEFDQVRKLHAEHGPNWKLLADITGRFYRHVRDAWVRIKFLNKKSGPWSQDEYQKLFDLVNMDLKLKIFTEKKSKHGMLRDNIGWTSIAETLGTRTHASCCKKWYNQLSSSMVREGIWAHEDDYLLLVMLFNLDSCGVEEVDWDNLIEGRTGEVCRRR